MNDADFQSQMSVESITAVAARISEHVLRTPTVEWPTLQQRLNDGVNGPAKLLIKLELLQRCGSFKPRGAVNTLMHLLDSAAGESGEFPGVTAFSAGNHAIATAYAAQRLGVSAKVVMPRTANLFRVSQVKELGAELIMGDTISDLLRIVEQIRSTEGRHLVHPFEGLHIAQGTATVGLELCQDVADLDAVIVPVGGGGLIAGIATVVKQMQPQCLVYGVEPEGASGMRQSLGQHSPAQQVSVKTIADSLGAPMHSPLSFNLVQRYVDKMVCVSDEQMRQAMRSMFAEIKLAVEPACAAPLAALNGPLADTLAGKRVALIACGSNIDTASYTQLISE